jgi:vacuolar-type H+-ATPase subunit H
MFSKDHPDVNRSKFSSYIYQQATKNDFFLYHFEYRYLLDLPEEWKNNGDQEAYWANGILKEDKYQHFRNDSRIGSFNPTHSSKWTSHELTHLLSGFAWNPNFTYFEMAIAARLAELIPVIVFYYWDEAFTKRCSKHREQASYGKLCFECEKLAEINLEDPISEKLMKEADIFFNSELMSIKKSIKENKFDFNPYWKLDLMSDAISYTKHQTKRLKSPEFHEFIEKFHPDNTGYFKSIEEYLNHIETLYKKMKELKPLSKYAGNRDLWISQDMAWRFISFQLTSNSESVKDECNIFIDELAENKNIETIQKCIEDYWQIYNQNEDEFLHPDMLFGLGYQVDKDHGKSFSMIESGLISSVGPALEYMTIKHDIDSLEMIVNFISVDDYDRDFLSHRFLKYSDKYLNGFFPEATKSLEILTALSTPDKWDYQDFIFIDNDLSDQDILNPTLGVFKVDYAMKNFLNLDSYLKIADEENREDLSEPEDDIDETTDEIIDMFAEETGTYEHEDVIEPIHQDASSYLAIFTNPFGKKNIFEIDEQLYQIIISLRAGIDIDISDEQLNMLTQTGFLLRKL